ncbi:anaerobic ribonucleoside-triphosphate reductase activating protein [Candidatus Peregrinibacteria bacterium]|nr:MAG: anaerobic ribonucleoside-triphosphate reductase activating protein [Candidatus Peregrinibacteria bacterium]
MPFSIAGLQKLTLLDFPKKTACIVFLAGCDFRCHVCHNSELVLPERMEKPSLSQKEFFQFLEKRKGLLDGVCVTGGEPTVHPSLPKFLWDIRGHGFLVKLDTNGNNPKMLSDILSQNLVDYVAMDIKASSEEKYSAFTGVKVNFQNITVSRDLLLSSGVPHEFRTTMVREFHDENEFQNILSFLRGVDRYFLQNFRREGSCLNSEWEAMHGFSREELLKKKLLAEQFVKQVELRL